MSGFRVNLKSSRPTVPFVGRLYLGLKQKKDPLRSGASGCFVVGSRVFLPSLRAAGLGLPRIDAFAYVTRIPSNLATHRLVSWSCLGFLNEPKTTKRKQTMLAIYIYIYIYIYMQYAAQRPNPDLGFQACR